MSDSSSQNLDLPLDFQQNLAELNNSGANVSFNSVPSPTQNKVGKMKKLKSHVNQTPPKCRITIGIRCMLYSYLELKTLLDQIAGVSKKDREALI